MGYHSGPTFYLQLIYFLVSNCGMGPNFVANIWEKHDKPLDGMRVPNVETTYL